MSNVGTVLNQCAKFHNSPANSSMGCHRLERKKKKNANGYNIRCLTPYYSAPASRLWSGTGQRTSSTSQAILALARQWGKILFNAWSNPGTHQIKYMRLFVFLPFLFLFHVVILLLLLLLLLLFISVLPLYLLLFLFHHFFLYSFSSSSVMSLTSSFTSLWILCFSVVWIQFFSVTLVHFSNHPHCNICKDSTTQWISYKSLQLKIFSLSLKSNYLSMNRSVPSDWKVFVSLFTNGLVMMTV